MIADSPILTDYAPGLEDCFLFDAIESSYEVSGVSGHIPAWLRGTWYVNGPACFQRGGRRYNHWLDGDGMVCALRFTEDRLTFTNRFVQTRKLQDEKSAGSFLYRGFGTSFTGDQLRRNVMLEPPVNVSVYPYAERLLAMGEQTLPYELDPVTLETRGEYDFEGKLNEVTPFAAHAKCDRGLVNFGISFSATQPMLNVFEFDSDGLLIRRRRYALEYPHSLHDFGFTQRHALFFVSPFLMNFQRFWGEGASVMESLSWNPELGSRILVVPRAGCDDTHWSLDAGGGYCLHVINCFETGDRLFMDVLLLDRPVYSDYQPVTDMFVSAPHCRPVRYCIDIASRQLTEKRTLDYDRCSDFPAVDQLCAGRAYTDFWLLGISQTGKAGRKFFDQLVHGSWATGDISDIYEAPRGEYLCGEPLFVSNPLDRGETVVITEHFSPVKGTAAIVLFDAFAVRNGPTAIIPLRHRIHPGFHTSFAHAGVTQ